MFYNGAILSNWTAQQTGKMHDTVLFLYNFLFSLGETHSFIKVLWQQGQEHWDSLFPWTDMTKIWVVSNPVL